MVRFKHNVYGNMKKLESRVQRKRLGSPVLSSPVVLAGFMRTMVGTEEPRILLPNMSKEDEWLLAVCFFVDASVVFFQLLLYIQ